MVSLKTEEQVIQKLCSGQAIADQISREYFETIKACSRMDDIFFDEFYMSLIYKFLETTQYLKEDRFKSDDRVAVTSLKRAGSILQQLQERFSNQQAISAKWDMVAFAVYSSALLHNIGYVFRNKSIHLTTDEGAYQREWYPLKNGTPFDFGEHYRVRFIRSLPEDMCDDLTRWLAMDIMSEVGINWIWQDKEILEYWRLALISFPDAFDVLNVGFDVSKEMELNETLKVVPVEEIEVDILDLAEDFLLWLKNSIEKKEVPINQKDAVAHQVNEGVLIDMDKAVAQYAKHKNFNADDIKSLSAEIELTGQAFINRLSAGGSVFVSYLLRHPVGQIGVSFRQRSLLGRAAAESQRVSGILIDNKYMPNMPKTAVEAVCDGHKSHHSVEQYLHSREARNVKKSPTHQPF